MAAPVTAPTRTLPIEHRDDAPAPARGLHVGPAGIAAVAIAAAVVAAAAVALLLSPERPGTHAEPGPTGRPASAAPATADIATSDDSSADDAAQRLAALRAAIAEQRRTGHLDPKATDELNKKIEEVERELTEGKPDKAAEKLADLRRKLDDLHRKGKITDVGFEAVRTGLRRAADTLPRTGQGDDDDG
jgi:hypothetical protein